MKYLKLFEAFESSLRNYKAEINGFEIEIEDASASDGVQVDEVTINLIGVGEDDYEYWFDLHTSTNGNSSVRFIGSNTIYIKLNKNAKKGFIENFNLVEGEFIDSESDLFDFLQVNSDSCVGKSTEIDGFKLKITNFNHNGGKEFGFIQTIINGVDIQFEIEQDATSGSLDFSINFSDEEEENKAKELGLEMTDELRDFLFEAYDRLTSEKR